MKTFKFNHQGFFLGNKFTISWNEAENCPENFNYYLVKTFDNIPDNKTNLQKRKNVTLSREEVIVDNDNNKYQIYILASEDGIEICATSETYIQLTPGGKLSNWASEASPTLGCSIEISRDIYIFIP